MMLEKTYQICIKTVMDTSCPDIRFDEGGISNYYWDFEKNVKSKWLNSANGHVLLERQVDAIKKSGKGRDFDCIMGLSGGADSSYMLHKMVTSYGLRPLVFHVDGGWNSEIATRNINSLIEKLGLDLYTEVINWDEMRDFQLAMFKSGVPHLDIPQDMAFTGVLYRFAEKHGIKYILNGGNISTECVQRPLDIIYWGTDMVHIQDIIKRYGSVKMNSYPFTSVFYHKLYLRYLRGVRVIKPLNFLPYIKHEAIREMELIYGWKSYPQKHFESRFTKFFEGFWLPSRFGFDMRRVDLSSLILTGQITRNQALEILQNPPLDKDSIKNEFEYIANKLEITTSDLWRYHDMPKKFYWDYKNSRKIFQMGEWVLTNLAGSRRGGAY
jgi:N-acetyl sugar amidotransferase